MNSPDSLNKCKTILIVEDTWQVRNLLAKIIRHFFPNHTVVAVDSGPQALIYIEQNRPPCLIVTDLEMAEMSGYDLMVWLADQPTTRHIPVVIVTSYSDLSNNRNIKRELRERGLELCPIVAKPIDMADFRAKLESALGRKPVVPQQSSAVPTQRPSYG